MTIIYIALCLMLGFAAGYLYGVQDRQYAINRLRRRLKFEQAARIKAEKICDVLRADARRKNDELQIRR